MTGWRLHRRGDIGLTAATALVTIAFLMAGPADADQPPHRSFTLAAAGDMLIHGRVARLADGNTPEPSNWDFFPMLSAIEPWVATADFAICHLEGTLSSTSRGLSYFPRLIAPHQIADAVASAGWDACSVASNHALDGGFDGIVATLDELDRRGIGHSGTARTPDERFPTLYTVNGVTIAHLSFSQHFNGLRLPVEQRWAANELVVARVLADARWARSRGAEFVVASLHWGTEYAVDPTAYQVATAEAILTDPAVDLILGHHAHVVQPIGMVAGKYVVYGMGNHVSNQNPRWGPEYYGTNDGLLILARVVEGADGFAVEHVDIVPTWVRFDDLRVYAAQDARRLGITRENTLTASIERTADRAMRLDVPGISLAPDPFPAVACLGRRATVLGSDAAETLMGTEGDDVIVARGGNDVIVAGGGDDLVCGGDGDDNVRSGAGRDRVFGGEGTDILVGDGGLNLMVGGPGVDRCTGTLVLFECERP